MPIYEYRRPDGSTFEVQQSFSDEALTHDPETGVPVARVLHPPAVHFKTKGFYSTEYSNPAPPPSNSNRDTALDPELPWFSINWEIKALAPIAIVPLFMPLMFLSTAFVPRLLMPGWIKVASRLNPYTYVIEATRQFVTGNLVWSTVGAGIAAAAILLVVTQIGVARSFSALVARE